MIAARGAPVEIDGEKLRQSGAIDVALLLELAPQRVDRSLARLDPATRQVPSGDVTVLDEKTSPRPSSTTARTPSVNPRLKRQ
jgi:hypothetical protein